MGNVYYFEQALVKQVKKEDGKLEDVHYSITVGIPLDRLLFLIKREDGTLMVKLDDWHDETQEVPNINVKGKQVGTKFIKLPTVTEFHLSKEEGEKFIKLTGVHNPYNHIPSRTESIMEDVG